VAAGGGILVVALKFRTAHKKYGSKTAALMALLQQARDGTLLTAEPQQQEPQHQQQEDHHEEQQQQHQEAVLALQQQQQEVDPKAADWRRGTPAQEEVLRELRELLELHREAADPALHQLLERLLGEKVVFPP
jgi:TATA-binding protein-associated factor Taf7